MSTAIEKVQLYSEYSYIEYRYRLSTAVLSTNIERLQLYSEYSYRDSIAIERMQLYREYSYIVSKQYSEYSCTESTATVIFH